MQIAMELRCTNLWIGFHWGWRANACKLTDCDSLEYRTRLEPNLKVRHILMDGQATSLNMTDGAGLHSIRAPWGFIQTPSDLMSERQICEVSRRTHPVCPPPSSLCSLCVLLWWSGGVNTSEPQVLTNIWHVWRVEGNDDVFVTFDGQFHLSCARTCEDES